METRVAQIGLVEVTKSSRERSARLGALIAGSLLLASCGGGGGGGDSLSAVGTCASAVNTTAYPHAAEPIGTVRQIYDGALSPDLAITTYRNIDRLFPTRTIEAGGAPYPLTVAAKLLTPSQITAASTGYGFDQFLQFNRVAALLILKDGKIVNETCRFGNTEKTRWMSMSVAKSVTSTLIGAAVMDGYISSIDDQVVKYVPRLVNHETQFLKADCHRADRDPEVVGQRLEVLAIERRGSRHGGSEVKRSGARTKQLVC